MLKELKDVIISLNLFGKAVLPFIYCAFFWFMILLFLILSFKSANAAEHSFDDSLLIEGNTRCDIDLDCTIYGTKNKCITPESRLNDEIKDILEESTTLNINLINAWKDGYNGVCAKIKRITIFPDGTTAETFLDKWIGTVIYSDQIPRQYKQEEEEKVEKIVCNVSEPCDICIDPVYNKTTCSSVLEANPEYKKEYVLPEFKYILGYTMFLLGLLIAFITYGRVIGFPNDRAKCNKPGRDHGHTCNKLLFSKKFYCKECRRMDMIDWGIVKKEAEEERLRLLEVKRKSGEGLLNNIKEIREKEKKEINLFNDEDFKTGGKE